MDNWNNIVDTSKKFNWADDLFDWGTGAINTSDEFDGKFIEVQPEEPNELLVNTFWRFGNSYKDYWYNYRGYTNETIDHFLLGYTGKYWVIPIYNNKSQLENLQCRGWDNYGNFLIHFKAPRQLEPEPAVHPKQCSAVAILKPSSWLGSRLKMVKSLPFFICML